MEGRGRCKPLGRRGETMPAFLSPSQKAAIKHVWSSPDRLMLIRGLAGTGKTTLTKTALAGIDVPDVILAPSAHASRGVLRGGGLRRPGRYAGQVPDRHGGLQQKAKGGLIWLDEASLAGARDVAKLTKVAESLNARLVMSGDRRQHKSVSRGDVLALLEDRAGLPCVEVSEIERQSGEYKSAVEKLAKGEVAAGFEKLDELNWVKEVSPLQLRTDDQGLADAIATDYLALSRPINPSSSWLQHTQRARR